MIIYFFKLCMSDVLTLIEKFIQCPICFTLMESAALCTTCHKVMCCSCYEKILTYGKCPFCRAQCNTTTTVTLIGEISKLVKKFNEADKSTEKIKNELYLEIDKKRDFIYNDLEPQLNELNARKEKAQSYLKEQIKIIEDIKTTITNKVNKEFEKIELLRNELIKKIEYHMKGITSIKKATQGNSEELKKFYEDYFEIKEHKQIEIGIKLNDDFKLDNIIIPPFEKEEFTLEEFDKNDYSKKNVNIYGLMWELSFYKMGSSLSLGLVLARGREEKTKYYFNLTINNTEKSFIGEYKDNDMITYKDLFIFEDGIKLPLNVTFSFRPDTYNDLVNDLQFHIKILEMKLLLNEKEDLLNDDELYDLGY